MIRCATILVQAFAIAMSLSCCGCGSVCGLCSTVTCPGGASVGESVEAVLTTVIDDITIEWSLDGDAELSDETSESAVITPTGPGVITVTVTATDERTGDSATASCAFDAVEESDPGSSGL